MSEQPESVEHAVLVVQTTKGLRVFEPTYGMVVEQLKHPARSMDRTSCIGLLHRAIAAIRDRDLVDALASVFSRGQQESE